MLLSLKILIFTLSPTLKFKSMSLFFLPVEVSFKIQVKSVDLTCLLNLGSVSSQLIWSGSPATTLLQSSSVLSESPLVIKEAKQESVSTESWIFT